MTSGTLGRVYHDGEIVVRQGDRGDTMFVIQEGEVEILVDHDDRQIPIRRAGVGELIGEMAIFEHEPRSATVRAVGSARLLTIDKNNFLRRISEEPVIAFRIVRAMSQRIRELSEQVAELKARC